MDEQLVGTLQHGGYKAEIFSTSMPGEFRVVYQDPAGRHWWKRRLQESVATSSVRARSLTV